MGGVYGVILPLEVMGAPWFPFETARVTDRVSYTQNQRLVSKAWRLWSSWFNSFHTFEVVFSLRGSYPTRFSPEGRVHRDSIFLALYSIFVFDIVKFISFYLTVNLLKQF